MPLVDVAKADQMLPKAWHVEGMYLHTVYAIATSTQLNSFTLQLKLRLKTQLLLKCAKHIHILILINAQHMDEASFI